MNILILGAGAASIEIAKRLSVIGYNISIVDISPERIKYISDKLDAKYVTGHCCDLDILREARIDKADIVIALTSDDAANILACQIAYSTFNIQKKIAKIHNSLYLKNKNILHEYIDLIVSFDQEVLEIVRHGIYIQDAKSVAKVSNALLVTTICKPMAPITTVNNIRHLDAISGGEYISIACIKRDNRYLHPDNISSILPNDEVVFCVNSKNKDNAMQLFGYNTNNKNIIVIGGEYIKQALNAINTDDELKIKIIETDAATANLLSNALSAEVIHCNSINFDVLRATGIENTPVIAITKDDKDNILFGMYAQQAGASQISILLHDVANLQLAQKIGFNSILDANSAIVDQIINDIQKQDKRTIMSLREYEIISIEVKKYSYLSNMAVSQIEQEYKIKIISIVRCSGDVLVNKNCTIRTGDTIISIIKTRKVKSILQLMQERPTYL